MLIQRRQTVVPFAMKLVALDGEGGKLRVGDLRLEVLDERYPRSTFYCARFFWRCWLSPCARILSSKLIRQQGSCLALLLAALNKFCRGDY